MKDLRKKRNHYLIYFMCLLLACTMWVSLQLQKEYVRERSLRVCLLGVPQNKTSSAKDSLFVIRARSRSTGFYLIYDALFNHCLELKAQEYLKKNSLDQWYWLPEKIFTQEMYKNASTSWLRYPKDTLWLYRNTIYSKWVHVRPNILSKKKDLSKNPLHFSLYPDKIRIYGTPAHLSTINHVKTKKIVFEKTRTQTLVNIGLEIPKEIQSPYNTVRLQLRPTYAIEHSLYVPIMLIGNKNKAQDYKLLPNRVKVSFSIIDGTYKSIEPYNFQVVADLSQRFGTRVPLRVVKSQIDEKNLLISPKVINVIDKNP